MTKNLYTILLLTLVTVVAWVSYQLFKLQTSSTIPAPTQQQIQELNPVLDKNVLEELRNAPQ